jgi:putative phosphoesterase
MRIGVLSDTHLPSIIRRLDELGPQAASLFDDVDLILHAGDVTAPSVVSWCEQFAPTLVARGNNDIFEHQALADKHVVEAVGWRIGLAHQVRPESRPIQMLLDDALGGEHVDLLIAGDTHVERLELRENTAFLNPGSPSLPHHKDYRLGSMATLDVSETRLVIAVHPLGHTPGRPNPCRALAMTLHRNEHGQLAEVAELT